MAVVIMMTPGLAYASENSKVDIIYESIQRVNDLGILSLGHEYKDLVLDRETFSKAIVVAAGLEDFANLSKGYSRIPDVEADSEYSHYINTAVSKRMMDIIMEDNNFYPKKEITFAEACTVMARTLGYYTLEYRETRNMYYISKMNELGITKDISLQAKDQLPLWAAALMFERFVNAKLPSYGDKEYHDQTGLYSEIILLNNPVTNENLTSNQVQTDKGIYYINPDIIFLELGCRYRVKFNNDEIIKVYTKENSSNLFVVDEKFDSAKLPKNISYYYNAEKKNFGEIKSNLMMGSSVLIFHDENGTNYEYGVIYNPVYSEPVMAKSGRSYLDTGNIDLNATIIDQYGQIIEKDQISDGDILYEVRDVFNNWRYVLVSEEKVEGRITGMELNYINHRFIEIDNKKYELDDSVDINKLQGLNIEDKVLLLMGSDGKVVDVNKIQYKSGPLTQCIITGNGFTSNKIGEEQVLTNKGSYFFLEEIDLEVGGTYKVVIDEGTIVKAEKLERTSSKFIVDKFLDNVVTYSDNGKKKKIALPKLQNYYYNGEILEYDEIMDTIKVGSTVILVKNPENIGYEYGIIIDSIYSYPDIINDAKGNVEVAECIVLGNSLTMDNLAANQVLTSSGTYYYLNNINLHLSSEYRIITDGSTIVKAERISRGTRNFVVERFSDNAISYIDNEEMRQMVLPRLSAYYYQGSKVDYNALKNIIKVNSTIILVQNEYSTGYEYALVVDPKYSEPKINGVLGYGVVDDHYNYRDVIYTVTDFQGNNSKTIAIDNKVTGQVTAILPNRSYPSIIQVGGKDYEISRYYDFSEENYITIGFKVTLILGYDGKILDMN
jgi:hypothetical protein